MLLNRAKMAKKSLALVMMGKYSSEYTQAVKWW